MDDSPHTETFKLPPGVFLGPLVPLDPESVEVLSALQAEADDLAAAEECHKVHVPKIERDLMWGVSCR